MSNERDYGDEDDLERHDIRTRHPMWSTRITEVRCYSAGSLATTSCLGCGAHRLLNNDDCKHCGAPPRTFNFFQGDQ